MRASLPGSGLTQVRSCLQGLNQVTALPGGRLHYRDLCSHLLLWPKLKGLNSRRTETLWACSTCREGPGPMCTCSLLVHTPVPGADGPA